MMGLPEVINLQLEKAEELRYGENPCQLGARYRFAESSNEQIQESAKQSWWDTLRQHGGKQLSYLNLNDSEAAWRLVCAFGSAFGESKDEHESEGQSAAVVVKHANPCGAALADDIATAWERAHACDPTSAFGGVIAFNRPVDASLAEKITENFLEVLIAPSYDEAALEVLARKQNLRVLEAKQRPADSLHFRSIDGGLLAQEATPLPNFSELCRKLELQVVSVANIGPD